MLGSIIGGAIGAAGSIFGGISASKAMKKVKRNLQQQDNQNWYDQSHSYLSVFLMFNISCILYANGLPILHTKIVKKSQTAKYKVLINH